MEQKVTITLEVDFEDLATLVEHAWDADKTLTEYLVDLGLGRYQ